MSSSDRVIYHIDCNAFYASVEEQLYPELKGRPMAVCGDPAARRGIILAKNEQAKALGVKTAETIWQAQRKCPDLVLRPARHQMYREYCERVNAIYEKYTSQVQRFGIDESYLDVTGSLHLFGGDALNLAHEIRRRVTSETGLTVSVGVSWCKAFAKLASDLRKPDAVSVISRANYQQVAWALPAGDLLFVGKNAAAELKTLGIVSIGQLAQANPEILRQRFGKLGQQFHDYANGHDDSAVLEIGQEEEPHSIGNGITFSRDLLSREDISTSVTALSDIVASRLRKQGLKGQTLQVTIKDTNLRVITRQKPLLRPSYIAAELAAAALELIEESWSMGTPIRMLTVTALKLIPEHLGVEQVVLFDEGKARREKRERLEKAVDDIRAKFGYSSVLPGSVPGNDLGIDEKE